MSGSCALAAKCIEQHKSRSFLDVRPTGTKVYAPPFYVDTWSLAPNTSFSFTDFLSIQGQTKVELDAHGMPEEVDTHLGVRPRHWIPLDSNTSRHDVKATIFYLKYEVSVCLCLDLDLYAKTRGCYAICLFYVIPIW